MSRQSPPKDWKKLRVSETELLEKDAKEMEIRLKMLQDRMEQQRLEDASVVKVGGARWSGARVDKGSVSTYARDLQEKYKKKREAEGGGDPALWVTANPRKQRSKPSNTNANEISGAILLDVSLDDLDYMGIKVLAHRKLILKGIEDLRKNKSIININPSETPQESPSTKSVDDSSRTKSKPSSLSVDELMKQEEKKKNATYWSDIEPMQKKETSGKVAVNSADDEDIYDEEAERAAFQEAVMEWRRSNKKDEANNSTTSKDITLSGGSLWQNPFVDGDSYDNESKSNKSSRKSSVKVIREYEMNKNNENSGGTNTNQSYRNASGRLDSDLLDEEAERLEFQRAVERWRQGGASQEENIKETTSQALGSNVTILTGKELADKLAKDLENEQAQKLKEFNDKLTEAKRRNEMLQSSMLEQKEKDMKEIRAQVKQYEDEKVDRKSISESKYDDIETPIPRVQQDCVLEEYDDILVRPDISYESEKDSQDRINPEEESCLEFQLLESKIGWNNESSEQIYIVEEVSDDE